MKHNLRQVINDHKVLEHAILRQLQAKMADNYTYHYVYDPILALEGVWTLSLIRETESDTPNMLRVYKGVNDLDKEIYFGDEKVYFSDTLLKLAKRKVLSETSLALITQSEHNDHNRHDAYVLEFDADELGMEYYTHVLRRDFNQVDPDNYNIFFPIFLYKKRKFYPPRIFKGENLTSETALSIYKYGKALERYLEDDTFEIDGVDLIPLYIEGKVDLSEAPYGAMLTSIIQLSRRFNVAAAKFERMVEPSASPILHELIKAYRQLTLYFYKLELPLDRGMIPHYTNAYIRKDKEALERYPALELPYDKAIRGIVKIFFFELDRYIRLNLPNIVDIVYTIANGILQANYVDSHSHPSFGFSKGAIAGVTRDKSYTAKRTARPAEAAQAFLGKFIIPEATQVNNQGVIYSELQFVPKDIRGPRTICKEDPSLAYMQQYYMQLLYQVIPIASRDHITLDNQDTNRYMSWLGSLTGEWATIDLKDASDSVLVNHVRRWFPEEWFNVFMQCRSDYVKVTINKQDMFVAQHKFAPMGSALCFPIECIIFYAIARSVVGTRVYVFGDDIVIPTQYFSAVVERLEECGFVVNRDKSLSRGRFRESCGLFSFAGHNINAIYRRDIKPTAEHYNELIAAWGPIRKTAVTPLPGVEGYVNSLPSQRDIVSLSPKIRVNHCLQRVEVLSSVHRTARSGDSLPDEFRYQEWLKNYSQPSIGETIVHSRMRYLRDARVISQYGEKGVINDIYVPIPYIMYCPGLTSTSVVNQLLTYFGYKSVYTDETYSINSLVYLKGKERTLKGSYPDLEQRLQAKCAEVTELNKKVKTAKTVAGGQTHVQIKVDKSSQPVKAKEPAKKALRPSQVTNRKVRPRDKVKKSNY